VPVCGQLITGEQWNEVIRDMGDTGQQQISPGLIPFANHEC
jgi:hypothetical protein